MTHHTQQKNSTLHRRGEDRFRSIYFLPKSPPKPPQNKQGHDFFFSVAQRLVVEQQQRHRTRGSEPGEAAGERDPSRFAPEQGAGGGSAGCRSRRGGGGEGGRAGGEGGRGHAARGTLVQGVMVALLAYFVFAVHETVPKEGDEAACGVSLVKSNLDLEVAMVIFCRYERQGRRSCSLRRYRASFFFFDS